jgi:hypothetical protein
MNKNVFMVVSVSENGKNYAYALRFGSNNNLVSVLSSIANLVSANVCDTWTAAKEIANAWNEAYKANGTYLFGAISF